MREDMLNVMGSFISTELDAFENLHKELEEKDKEIEKLNKESKILRENAEHNDKVVDKVNWENKRLNNKLKDIKSQLDYLETYSSKEDVFEDMKRRLDRIESIVNRK